MGMMKPKEFDPESQTNPLIKSEVDFEGLCSALEEAGINHPKSLTTFEFYSRIHHFEKRKSNTKTR